jgi:hypothetical protein
LQYWNLTGSNFEEEIRSEPRVAASGAQQVQHELKARRALSGLERSDRKNQVVWSEVNAPNSLVMPDDY